MVAHSITYLKTKNHILISFVSKPVGLLLGNVGQERSLVTGFMSLKRIGCNFVTVTFSAMRSNTDYERKAYKSFYFHLVI